MIFYYTTTVKSWDSKYMYIYVTTLSPKGICWRMPHVKHELSTTPEHTSVHSYFRASEMKKSSQSTSSIVELHKAVRFTELRKQNRMLWSKIPKSQSIFPDKIIQDRRKQHTITKKKTFIQLLLIYIVYNPSYFFLSFI